MVAGQPMIWVDSKKAELILDLEYGNRGSPLRGSQEPPRLHELVIHGGWGKATPHEVCDLKRTERCVNVGIDHHKANSALSIIMRS